ncbi:hypothetical protein PJJ28_14540 [Mycobacterium kansasii]
MFAVIDEMIADGRLVYDPGADGIDIGAWPKKGHRPRSLLRQVGYVAWRQRAEDRLLTPESVGAQ